MTAMNPSVRDAHLIIMIGMFEELEFRSAPGRDDLPIDNKSMRETGKVLSQYLYSSGFPTHEPK
jgi:hypothetical protein